LKGSNLINDLTPKNRDNKWYQKQRVQAYL